jgi:hypothetical protein
MEPGTGRPRYLESRYIFIRHAHLERNSDIRVFLKISGVTLDKEKITSGKSTFRKDPKILEIALEDVRASDLGSHHLEEISDLLQHTLKCDVKSRWDTSRVKLFLEGIIKESCDSVDQESHLVEFEDGSPDPEIKDLGLENSEMEDDGRIPTASFMSFSDDVSPKNRSFINDIAN